MTVQQLRTNESNDQLLPRFDSDSVRQVLLRATAIHEQQKQEMLSAAQIEALGQELGISPSAVRQALGEATTQPTVATQPTITATIPVPRTEPMTVAQMLSTPLPGVIYGLFAAYFVASPISVIGVPDAAPNLAILTMGALYVFPAVLAFLVGWVRRDIRAGGLVGLFLTVIPLIATAISVGLKTGTWRIHDPAWVTGMATACISLGCLGGWLRQRWEHERAERRRLQNR